MYFLEANKSRKCIIFNPGAVIKLWLSALQCKVGLLCFTIFYVLYLRRIALIFLIYFIWISENHIFIVSRICFIYYEDLKRTAYIQHEQIYTYVRMYIYSNFLNYLFLRSWLFSMSRKLLLTYKALPSSHTNSRELSSNLKLSK